MVNLDRDWRLWPDSKAGWQNDPLYLPENVKLNSMPVNPPSGGWNVLNEQQGIPVRLPATVEQYFWGKFGLRPFNGPWEDGSSQNGNYVGVSWWWRKLDIKKIPLGRQVIISFRGARLRAEVYCNGHLCGYNVITEMPFTADITSALNGGGDNILAVRITNPGGSMNWVDRDTFQWGGTNIPYSHGCGGIDGGVVLKMRSAVEVADLAVLNQPDPHSIQLITEVACEGVTYKGPVEFGIKQEGKIIWSGTVSVNVPPGKVKTISTEVTLTQVELWDLQHPTLYTAYASVPGRPDSGRLRDFGFRSFTVEAIGSNVTLRLNGKRVVLRSAASWGWWGGSGLWPTDELAIKEVTAAKSLGLNCLQFSRNVGKTLVLDAQDRLGLLRCEEPGAGAAVFLTDSELTPAVTSGARRVSPGGFAARYEQAKIFQMIKRDRSHPSLISYCLQNELDEGAVKDEILTQMHKLDPSRIIVLKSGSQATKQKLILPWENEIRSDGGNGLFGWTDVHTTGGPGVYVDDLYKNPNDFSHQSKDHRAIVVWGEMMGFGVPGDADAITKAYQKAEQPGFDRSEAESLVSAYEKFIDAYGFRSDFPIVSSLFQAIGEKSYFAWQKIIENCRISDCVDWMVLNGWEDSLAHNYSGIVDLHRGFKSNPEILRRATLPEMLVIKPRHWMVANGETVTVDLYLVNETNRKGPYTLVFQAKTSEGALVFEKSETVNLVGGDRFGQLLHEGYSFSVPSSMILSASLTSNDPEAKLPPLSRDENLLGVQLAGIATQRVVAVEEPVNGSILKALGQLGIHAEPFADSKNPAVILVAAIESGSFSKAYLDRVSEGARLVVISDEGKNLVAIAKQLAAAGAFKWNGSVGSDNLPWMGFWYFTRRHWLFNGLPSGGGVNWQYQIRNSGGEGLLIDAPGMEVVAGYGRDHQMKIGIGACVIPYGKGEIVLFSFPGMVRGLCGENAGIHPVAAQRLILNAIIH